MATEQPALGPCDRGTTDPCTGIAVSIRDPLVLTSAWVASAIISVRGARRCCLRVKYAADASGTGNRPQMRVMTSAEMSASGTVPAVADDVWYPPVLIDSTPTAGDLTGTIETGAVLSLVNHGVVVARPGAWTLGDAADAGTNVARYKLTFDVTDDVWLYVAVKELGDTDAGDLGVMGIKANLAK
jgi:hypothetical protein